MKKLAPVVVVLLLGVSCGGGGATPTREPEARAPAETDAPAEPASTIDDDCALLTRGTGPLLYAVDDFFAPECAIVRSDAEIRVLNYGPDVHTFTISEEVFRQTPFLVDLDDIEKGEEARSEPLNLEPGFYEFFCKIHAGMDGVLQVVEPVS